MNCRDISSNRTALDKKARARVENIASKLTLLLAIIMARLWMATQFDCAYESYPYIDRAADPSLFLSLQQQHDLR